MKSNADHFWKAFDHCVKCQMTKKQAMLMCKQFSSRGFIDAGEGCSHYVLKLICGAK